MRCNHSQKYEMRNLYSKSMLNMIS